MTFEVVAFEAWHVRAMNIQPAQRNSEITSESLTAPTGDAWTVLVDGHPMACGGLVEIWAGRYYAWALLDEAAGPHMVRITRAIRCGLAQRGLRRVEMAVNASFDAGARWAELLGFRRETPEPMQGFLPNGRSAYLYARV